MMTNKGIAPHSIAIDGIVDGFIRSGDVGQAISFAQHAFNQVCCWLDINRYTGQEYDVPSNGVVIQGVPFYGVLKVV